MSDTDLVNINDLTADDIDDLLSMSFEVTDDYIANRLAAIGPDVDVIEPGDTVRFVGKRTPWVVAEIGGDKAEVYASFGHPRRGGRIYRSRDVRLDRIELVRKGNRLDDFLAALDANDGRLDCTFDYSRR